MTAPRRHSTGDGFGRSTGDAATRGAVLIGVAVLIGLFLLWKGFDGGDSAAIGDAGDDVVADAGDGDDGSADGATDASTAGGETDGTTSVDTSTTTDTGTDTTDVGDAGTDTGDAGVDTGTDGSVDCSTVGGDVRRSPNEVQVIAANGTGTSGLAGSMASQLTSLNYVATAKDAEPTPTETSKVLYTQCYSQDAAAIATAIGATGVVIEPLVGPPPVKPGTDPTPIGTANVFVIMGTDGIAAPS